MQNRILLIVQKTHTQADFETGWKRYVYCRRVLKNAKFSTTVLKYILDIVCAYVNALPGFTACGDGSIDVKERHIRTSKVPYLRAFRAVGRQMRKAKMASKIAPWKYIKGNLRRVE